MRGWNLTTVPGPALGQNPAPHKNPVTQRGRAEPQERPLQQLRQYCGPGQQYHEGSLYRFSQPGGFAQQPVGHLVHKPVAAGVDFAHGDVPLPAGSPAIPAVVLSVRFPGGVNPTGDP